jgi:hypothetical protein
MGLVLDDSTLLSSDEALSFESFSFVVNKVSSDLDIGYRPLWIFVSVVL